MPPKITDEMRQKIREGIERGENPYDLLKRLVKEDQERRDWERQVRERAIQRARAKIRFGSGGRRI